jgi:hypothetical protein
MLTRDTASRLHGTSIIEAPGSDPGASVKRGLIPLRAVFGQDEANHDTECYTVDNNGLVWVPIEAVAPLTAIGGFVLAGSRPDAVPTGALKLRHNGSGGCSYHGRQYLADANGDVLVPAEAAAELLAHGFVSVSNEQRQPCLVETDRRQIDDSVEG